MPPQRPTSLLVAAVALVVEAVAAGLFGVAEAFQTQSSRLVVGVGAALLLLGYAVLLGALARALLRVRRWARGPVVATQLIHLPLAWSFANPPTTGVGVVLGLVSVTALVAVLVPSSTAVLTTRED